MLRQVDPGLKVLGCQPVESTSPFKSSGFGWVNMHPYSSGQIDASEFRAAVRLKLPALAVLSDAQLARPRRRIGSRLVKFTKEC